MTIPTRAIPKIYASEEALDCRPLMAVHADELGTPLHLVAFPRHDAAYCSACRGADRIVRDDLWVVAHKHPLRPLGHLYSRCPQHQLEWEQKMRWAA